MTALVDSEPRRLPELHEARDLLLRVFLKDGLCIAIFTSMVMAFPEELMPKLAGLAGNTVTVLRLDGRYYVRAV